jgi:hypothetical protein
MSPRYSVSGLLHRAGNLAYRAEQILYPRASCPIVARPQNLAAGVDLLRRTSLPRLREPDFIENDLLPQLGLNDELLHEQPNCLTNYLGKGFGWRIWQYPSQFSKYLIFLSSITPLLSSYAEIGCRFGGTFVLTVEYLARFNPDFGPALAVDLIDESELLKQYHQYRDFQYCQGNSTGPEFLNMMTGRHYGLAFIDGDHSFDGILKDFDVMSASDVVALHDIHSPKACPGTTNFWHSLRYFRKNDGQFYVFLETRRFIEDLEAVCLIVPSPDEPQPEPRVTPQFIPDLGRPFSESKTLPGRVSNRMTVMSNKSVHWEFWATASQAW